MKRKKCIIFGMTIFTKMLRFYIDTYSDMEVVAYAVDEKYKEVDIWDDLPAVAFEKLRIEYPADQHVLVIGTGYSQMNNLRKQKYEEGKSMGYSIEGFIHPSVVQHLVKCGEGNIVLEGAILGYKVKLGNCNIIWNGCNISHESEIGDFNYFSPGVTTGGKTLVKNNCFFGMNATIRGARTIENYTLLGAGCYMNDDTEEYGVYVPARSICLNNKKSTDML